MMRSLLLVSLLLASSAQAAEWTRLMRIPGEDQYFYDRSKLVIQGDEITYWKKVVFHKPQPVKNQSAAWVLMREQINCVQHTLRLVSYLYYAADGATIEYVPDHEKEGTPIIPDTLGDAFERNMCELVRARQEEEKAAAEQKSKAEQEAAEAGKQEAAPTPPQPTVPAPPAPDVPAATAKDREPAVVPGKTK